MLLSYLSFFTFLSCIAMGIIALLLDPKAKLNRAFSFITLTSATWAFGYIFVYIESAIEAIWMWYRISAAGGIFLFFATFNYLYIFADLKNNIRRVFSIVRVLYFLLATYLVYAQFTDTLFVVDFVKTPYGNAGIVNTSLPGYYLLYIMAAVCFISEVIFLAMGNKHNTSKSYKVQIKGLIVFTVIPILLVILSNFLVPSIGKKPFPFIGVLFLNITVAGIFYLITNFRLMRVDYSLLKPDDIVSHISDMILLLDTKHTIVMANDAAAELLSVTPDALKNMYFPGLIAEDDNIEVKIQDLINRNEDSFRMRLTFRKTGNDSVLTETYFSKVKDKLEDIVGYLVISNELRGRKEFLNAFGISGREMEVLDLLLAGSYARSIGEKLRISRRTVESHLINIYNKLGINNKSELFSFCAKFNLIP